LQKFLRFVEPVLEIGPQRLGSDLRGDRDIARQRIGGDKFDFIYLDRALASAESLFHLLGKVLRLGAAHGKCPHQAGKVFHSYI
jgi:hypothetical protein